MLLANSAASAIYERLGTRARTLVVAGVLVTASLALTFTAAVIWDVAGRVTTVRSDKGKVEIDLHPRFVQVKR